MKCHESPEQRRCKHLATFDTKLPELPPPYSHFAITPLARIDERQGDGQTPLFIDVSSRVAIAHCDCDFDHNNVVSFHENNDKFNNDGIEMFIDMKSKSISSSSSSSMGERKNVSVEVAESNIEALVITNTRKEAWFNPKEKTD